ncbi:aminoglycoside phosphotransferase family protein [Streptomyces sp. HNM0645]|uniref:aminoglycoside phosphotransferase family protein n=1 Tax=Streptomyces sp. HNM0645 TaxID=2782343 RepID=UPI0024B6D817|nr:aminoglycoside phosphotransferase family protein [Streptomyces sp. HNM0645]MDI9889487.1 aminoglycoside phosphotransferase family protein [Streptomyces sp. HNM0645]
MDDGTGGGWRKVPLVLKHGSHHSGRSADQAARQLRAAGLDRPPYQVVRTRGVHPAGTLVTEHAPGRPWALSLTGSEADRAVEAVAGFLTALQGVSAELPPRPAPHEQTLRQLADLAEFAAVHAWDELAAVQWLTELVDPLLEPTGKVRLVAGHGDLHPKNVYLDRLAATPPLVTVIDLDHAGMYEPALDVGYAVCQILVTGTHQGLPQDELARVAGGLWGCYRSHGGRADEQRIAVQVACAFVQVLHFELIGYGGGGRRTLARWARLATEVLDDGPGALRRLARGAR